MSRSHKRFDMKGEIKTSPASKEYREGWDSIFAKKETPPQPERIIIHNKNGVFQWKEGGIVYGISAPVRVPKLRWHQAIWLGFKMKIDYYWWRFKWTVLGIGG